MAILESLNTTESNSTSTDEQWDDFFFEWDYSMGAKPDAPYWKSISASKAGQITIKFSELFIIPPNLTAFEDDEVLQVTLTPYSPYSREYLDFTWNVTSFTPLQFVIQLYFYDPTYVSNTGKYNLDLLTVTSYQPAYFRSM